MHRKMLIARRRLTALALAFGMLVAAASPSAAEYCVRRNDDYLVCVG